MQLNDSSVKNGSDGFYPDIARPDKSVNMNRCVLQQATWNDLKGYGLFSTCTTWYIMLQSHCCVYYAYTSIINDFSNMIQVYVAKEVHIVHHCSQAQVNHGGWNDRMTQCCGRVGRLEAIDKAGDMKAVEFRHQLGAICCANEHPTPTDSPSQWIGYVTYVTLPPANVFAAESLVDLVSIWWSNCHMKATIFQACPNASHKLPAKCPNCHHPQESSKTSI